MGYPSSLIFILHFETVNLFLHRPTECTHVFWCLYIDLKYFAALTFLAEVDMFLKTEKTKRNDVLNCDISINSFNMSLRFFS